VRTRLAFRADDENQQTRLLYIGGMTFLTRAETRSNSFKSTRLYLLQTGISERVGGPTTFGGLVS